MRKSVYIIALLFSLTSGFALADLSGLLKKVEETVSDIEDTLEDAEDALSPSESSADEVKEALDGNQPNNDALQKKPQPNQSTDSSQKAAETSESGEKGVAIRGKLYADGPPKVGLIGQRFRAGEYGTDPRYYALFIGLIDRRDTTLNCNTYVLDRFSESGNRSEFKSDIDRLDAMRGKEVVLENVRKSTAGKTCVFSGYRLNNDVSSFAYENRDRNLVDMLPAGNRIVDKVSIRGIRLCGDLTEASEILEARGYKNAATYAKNLGSISNVGKRQGIDNYLFTINNDPYNKSSRMYSISFQSSFKDGPNIFDLEKARFERDTGIKLSCKESKVGTNDIRNVCQYPPGEADRSRPGFRYSITHAINSKSMYVDAAAWGLNNCGIPLVESSSQSQTKNSDSDKENKHTDNAYITSGTSGGFNRSGSATNEMGDVIVLIRNYTPRYRDLLRKQGYTEEQAVQATPDDPPAVFGVVIEDAMQKYGMSRGRICSKGYLKDGFTLNNLESLIGAIPLRAKLINVTQKNANRVCYFEKIEVLSD